MTGERRRKVQAALKTIVEASVRPTSGSTVLSVKMVFSEQPMLQLNLVSSRSLPGETTPDNDDGNTRQLCWEFPLRDVVKSTSEFGDERVGDYALDLPRTFKEDLCYRLQTLESVNPRPLWLNLCRPYGLLGSLDWEKQIGEALNRPLLRLPDFPVSPAQRPDVLEGAVIVDPGETFDPLGLSSSTKAICQAFLEHSSRKVTHIHVFAAAPAFDCLKQLSDNPQISVHDPAEAPSRNQAIQQNEKNAGLPLASVAWAQWIIQNMDGRNLDVVHLVGRSSWNESVGELVLSSSPSSNDPQVYNLTLDLDELSLLLNRSGSWATVFVPTTRERAQSMASVADTFAQRRAGAVMYHPLNDLEAYNAACKLLFDQQSFNAPNLKGAFLYCHPDFTHRGNSTAAWPSFGVLLKNAAVLVDRLPRPDRVLGASKEQSPDSPSAATDAAPSWLAASQRFLESAAFEEVRKFASDVLLSSGILPRSSAPDPSTQPPSPNTTGQTLDEIATVIQAYINHDKKEP
jgi:hypothetical protein